jgi:hypothetical protein
MAFGTKTVNIFFRICLTLYDWDDFSLGFVTLFNIGAGKLSIGMRFTLITVAGGLD